jgi:hypothetical protein
MYLVSLDGEAQSARLTILHHLNYATTRRPDSDARPGLGNQDRFRMGPRHWRLGGLTSGKAARPASPLPTNVSHVSFSDMHESEDYVHRSQSPCLLPRLR